MNLIHDQEAAAELAALVLDMGMVTDKGLLARNLARKVLGVTDAGVAPNLVPVFTNGTLRMIPRDEPVFLLRGQDRYAAATVRHWASLVAQENNGANAEIVTTATAHAATMDAWPVKKSPDLPRA